MPLILGRRPLVPLILGGRLGCKSQCWHCTRVGCVGVLMGSWGRGVGVLVSRLFVYDVLCTRHGIPDTTGK